MFFARWFFAQTVEIFPKRLVFFKVSFVGNGQLAPHDKVVECVFVEDVVTVEILAIVFEINAEFTNAKPVEKLSLSLELAHARALGGEYV